MDYIESWLPSLSLEECEQYMYGQIFARAKLKYVFTSTKFIRKQEEMHLQKALSFFKEARASTTYILSVKNTVIYDSDNDEEA